jgi:hypothetical protein
MRTIGCLIAAVGFMGLPLAMSATYLPLMGKLGRPSGFYYWPIVLAILVVVVGMSMYAFDLIRRESDAGRSSLDRYHSKEKKCPDCGTRNPIGQKYCLACERPLD